MGGFFDHVAPPYGPIPTADAALNSDGLLGFRVPNLIVSPYAVRHEVSHVPIDHTSILRMIEWRWSLPPLTVRDASATNLAELLDFRVAKPRRPRYDVPDLRVPTACLPSEPDKWLTLQAFASGFGWIG